MTEENQIEQQESEIQTETLIETPQETIEKEKKVKPTPKNRNTEIKQLQDELDVFKTENETLQSQLKDYQTKLAELELKAVEVEKQSAEYLTTIHQKDVSLKLAEKGLSEFSEFFKNIDSENVDVEIEKFQGLLKSKEIDNSYKPVDHKSDDAYSVAKNKGDLKSMFSSILFNK